MKMLSVEISRQTVEEFFDVFKCHCDAWSSEGQTSSKTATVDIGCKYQARGDLIENKIILYRSKQGV